MGWEWITLVAFGLILLLLFIEIPVAVCLGLSSMVVAMLFLGRMGIIQYTFWQVCNSFILQKWRGPRVLGLRCDTQIVVMKAKPEICIAHAPGHMFVGDLLNEELATL